MHAECAMHTIQAFLKKSPVPVRDMYMRVIVKFELSCTSCRYDTT